MPDVPTKSFQIDSTLELLADYYDAETPDSTAFLAASRTDTKSFSFGLLDPNGNPQEIGFIEQGTVDEYELDIAIDNNLKQFLVGRIRGRDSSAKAIDGVYRMRYLRTPVREVVGPPEPPPGNIPPIPTTEGRFTASQVARDACDAVGLGLSWEVDDYELQTDFDATGKVSDILRRLVEPFTLVEPFRADLFRDGTTVIVRPRRFIPSYVTTLANAARGRVTIRKRPGRKVGRVVLTGMSIPVDADEEKIPGVISSGTITETATDETFSEDGTLLSRVETRATYRTPDRSLLNQVKNTYGMFETGVALQLRETIVNVWSTVLYDESGPVGQPKHLTQQIIRETLDEDLGSLQESEREDTGYSYDGDNFQTGETTVRQRLNTDTGQFELASMTVKIVRRIGSLLVESIVEEYTADEDGKKWILSSRKTQTQGGYPPGGPGRGFQAGGDNASVEPIVVGGVISSDVDAQDVSYSNPHLPKALLQKIFALFQAADNLWEYEVVLEGVGMPWIRRGLCFSLSGVFLEDGVTQLSLPPLLVTEVTPRYREVSEEESVFTMGIRAFAWSAT